MPDDPSSVPPSAMEALRGECDLLRERCHSLEEMARVKEVSLSRICHEIRTPLQGVVAFAELLRPHLGKADIALQQEYLEDILISAAHLLRLTEQVSEISIMASGEIKLNPQTVDLPVLIDEAVAMTKALALEKRLCITVELDLPVEPNHAMTSVILDPDRFKQVLINYLSNAIKFTPESGSITVRLISDPTDFFRVEVVDTGMGMTADEIQRLFTPFERFHPEIPGSGLGLAMTKKIVEAQGGSVGVKSVPGTGSCFYAILPRCCPLSHSAPGKSV